MRVVIGSGGNVENSDNDGRAGVRAAVTEHCVGCGDEHPIGAMIAWDEGMFCLDCVRTILDAERCAPADELAEELRGVRSASASARRRAALERSGLRIVHNSEDTGE